MSGRCLRQLRPPSWTRIQRICTVASGDAGDTEVRAVRVDADRVLRTGVRARAVALVHVLAVDEVGGKLEAGVAAAGETAVAVDTTLLTSSVPLSAFVNISATGTVHWGYSSGVIAETNWPFSFVQIEAIHRTTTNEVSRYELKAGMTETVVTVWRVNTYVFTGAVVDEAFVCNDGRSSGRSRRSNWAL